MTPSLYDPFRVDVFGGRSYPVAAPAYGGLATGYFLAGFQPAIRFAGVERVIPYPAFSLQRASRTHDLLFPMVGMPSPAGKACEAYGRSFDHCCRHLPSFAKGELPGAACVAFLARPA